MDAVIIMPDEESSAAQADSEVLAAMLQVHLSTWPLIFSSHGQPRSRAHYNTEPARRSVPA